MSQKQQPATEFFFSAKKKPPHGNLWSSNKGSTNWAIKKANMEILCITSAQADFGESNYDYTMEISKLRP